MREKLPFVGFFLSCLLAAWFIGFLTYDKNWFPKQTLLAAKFAQRDWREHWKTYFGVAPTKFFRKSFSVGEGVTVYEKELVAPGYTFLTGFFDDSPGMALIENGGKILNVWPAAFSSTWSDYSHIKEEKDIPLNDWSVHVHGAQPLPDGSVIYNFANIGLVRQGRCGQIMWRLPYPTHHSVYMNEGGEFWVSGHRTHEQADSATAFIKTPYVDQTLLKVSPDGKILKEVSLLKTFIDAGMLGVFFPTGVPKRKKGKLEIGDLLHLNDIEELSADMAAQYPTLSAGDVVVSMRNINLIAVLDGESFKVKWHKTGPWLRQHDPDFVGAGKIAVYDNGDDSTFSGDVLRGSTIMAVDPATDDVEIVYQGTEKAPFYSKYMGKMQFLSNGNLLITESVRGRVFELTKNRKIVWEFISRFDKGNVLLVQEGSRYSKDYFKVGNWDCSGKTAKK